MRYFIYYVTGYAALAFYSYSLKSKVLKLLGVILVLFFYSDQTIKSYYEWKAYYDNKMLFRSNFVEALKLVKSGKASRDEVLQHLKKLGLPYAGYPNYELPLNIILDPKSQKIFQFLIDPE